MTPAYYTSVEKSAATIYRTGEVNVQNDWVRWDTGYRLPIEAEWEYAVRGGAEGHRYPWNDTDAFYSSRANCNSSGTTPLGSFAANGFRLFDMAGNVWEWVWDWYGAAYYSGSPESDPRGPASGSSRVKRGGSWDYGAFRCRVALRGAGSPGGSYFDFGFRAVLPSGQ